MNNSRRDGLCNACGEWFCDCKSNDLMDKKCFALYMKDNLMMVIKAEDIKEAYKFLISFADSEESFRELYNKIYEFDTVSDPYYEAVNDGDILSPCDEITEEDAKQSRMKFLNLLKIKYTPILLLNL